MLLTTAIVSPSAAFEFALTFRPQNGKLSAVCREQCHHVGSRSDRWRTLGWQLWDIPRHVKRRVGHGTFGISPTMLWVRMRQTVIASSALDHCLLLHRSMTSIRCHLQGSTANDSPDASTL